MAGCIGFLNRRQQRKRKTLDVPTLQRWRDWLARHHGSETEVWLVFRKRHTGRPSIAYADALDEALCFGWIDSLIKRLDESRYARKFTPRKPESRWSAANRAHYARLKAAGRMMPPGLKRPPTGRTYDAPRAKPTKVPGYIRAAFEKDPEVLKRFESLPPSQRWRYIGWIDFAKQTETKLRRLQEAVRLLAAGKPLGLK